MLKLDGSVSSSYDAYAMSSIYKRLCISSAMIGIGIGKKKGDRCPVCVCWDTVVNPQMINFISEAFDALEGLLPGYFRAFGPIEAIKGFHRSVFKDLESSDWMHAVAEYVEGHKDTHPEMRKERLLDNGDQCMLNIEALEAQFAPDMHKLADEADEYIKHWKMRDWSSRVCRTLRLFLLFYGV